MSVTMPLPSRRRALELGAGFIEQDLHEMRRVAQRNYESSESNPLPVTHNHEHDLMKAAEWAAAATTLRMLAEREDSDGR